MLGDTAKANRNELSGVIKGVFEEGWLYVGILLLGLVYFLNPEGFIEFLKDLIILIWPIILAVPLWKMTLSLWVHWRQEIYIKKLTKWAFVEIKIPREIRKNAKAMEQVWAGIHGMRNVAGNLREIYWDGEVTRWYTVEMVSFGGEVHFYMRLLARQVPLLKAQFHTVYPEVEIEEAEDYAHHRLPQSMQEIYMRDHNMWGTEMVLRESPAYPIKMYEDFEAVAEEKEYDSMSVFLEVLGAIKKEEFAAIQILAFPIGNEWREHFMHLVEEKRRPAVEPEVRTSAEGEEYEHTPFAIRTPGETEVLENIERNLSKPAFESMIRFLYISPKTLFHDTYPRRGLKGAFNQFNKASENAIIENSAVSTRVEFWFFPYLFPALRAEIRKQRLLFNFLHRELPPETFMGKVINMSPFDLGYFKSKQYPLNIEALATIFHPPSYVAMTAMHTQRIESKKVPPSSGLQIYGSEDDIEKYL